jgi:hypothetical protein
MRGFQSSRPVVLLPAYRWQCPGCRSDNYEDPEPVEGLTLEQKRERIAAAEGVDVEEMTLTDQEVADLDIVDVPKFVQCACNNRYPAVQFLGLDVTAEREDEDGDDDGTDQPLDVGFPFG